MLAPCRSSSPRHPRSIWAVTLAVSVILRATVASAQIGWADRVDTFLGTSPSVSVPLVSADASGNVTAVWSQLTSTGQEVVRAARFVRAAGAWSGSIDLSSAGTLQSAGFPDLALNDAGDGMAVWMQGPGAVRAAAYAAATGSWSPAMDVSPSGAGPVVAIAANGDAVALWTGPAGAGTVIKAARYSAALGSWSAETDISGPNASAPRVAVDPAGAVVAVWLRSDGAQTTVQSARTAGAVWGSVVDLSAAGQSVGSPHLTIAASGDVFAIWPLFIDSTTAVVQAARYPAGDASWGQAVDVSAAGQEASDPQIAADPAGNAVAVWKLDGRIQSASYRAATGAWSRALDLAIVGQFVSRPAIGVDHAGNASAVWYVGGTYTLQTARRTAAGEWTTTILPVNRALDARVAVDPFGNATVIWRRLDLSLTMTVLTTQWRATPVAPAITEAVPGNGTLTLAVTTPPAELGFANTNYEYSIDDGASWTARSPASADPLIAVTGLANGVTRAVRVRGVNVAGPGAPSAPVACTPDVAPRAPTGLVAVSIVGRLVTLRWAPAADSVPPSGYVVEGGVLPGQVLATLPTGGTAPTFTFSAPSGAFYVRLHAIAGVERSGPSNEIRIGVNVAAPPSAPAGLLGVADGAVLSLVWQPTHEGGAATGFVLDVSGALSGSLVLPAGDRFAYPAVPPGTYHLAVRAVNGAGSSAPSNSVTLTFPGSCVPPAAPSTFSAAASGRTIFASWTPPAAGTAATGYVLIVAGALSGSFSTTGLALSGAVAPGSYTLTAVAANACGISPGTAPQTVIVH
jgi:hypothetical protein